MGISGEQLSELMSAYLDNEVNDREKALVEETLRADPGARRLLEELRKTVSVVGSLPRHAAPPDLVMELDARLERTQLLASFRKEPEAAPITTSWPSCLRAAAMLGFVLVAGWWFLASQQRPSTQLAKSSKGSRSEVPEASRSVTDEAVLKKAEKVELETLLAKGADPVSLVNHSFEIEPVRILVTARDAAERDLLTRKFVEQLAQAHTENLARRTSEPQSNRVAGSFYIEGKPGVNFKNAQEKQILVRLPQVQAEQILDKVVSGSQIPSDQFAIQVGPATVRGQENARLMLQGMAGNGAVASGGPEQPDTIASKTDGKAMSTGLLRTLEKIVGIEPALSGSPGAREDSRMADAAAGSSREMSGLKRESGASAVPAPEDTLARHNKAAAEEKDAGDMKKPTSESLVSRGYNAARSHGAERERTLNPESAAVLADKAAQSSFITIVVEFAIPEPQPARRDAGRLRS